MSEVRQALSCCAYSFHQWRKSARVWTTFSLAFILCFFLTDRIASFARDHDTYVQILEPFVWSFGDGTNILLASLLLVLLFGDMPFLTAATPFFLMRTTRRAWLTGQTLYVFAATALYTGFVFVSTCVLCAPMAFAGDQWSEASALIGYARFGDVLGVPANTTTMEMSRPAWAAAMALVLLLLYMLVLGLLMLAVHLRFGRRAALGAAVAFSLWGLLLEPALVMEILHLPQSMEYRANVIVGWLSPLNQATFPMHSFGHNALPTIPQSVGLFAAAAVLLYAAALQSVRALSFEFTGAEQ